MEAEMDYDKLERVDDWEPALERLPEDTPDEAGLAYLAQLEERLNARYEDDDVQEYVRSLRQ